MKVKTLVVACALVWSSLASATPPDTDFDGYPDSLDCEPDNVRIHPRAREIPYDGIDQDCNGADLCDVDLDGFDAADCGGDDCDDDQDHIFPGSVDIPLDGIDQDCDGEDAIIVCDHDQDGFDALHCDGSDCNDAAPDINPDVLEIDADGIDQDCDGHDDCVPVQWVQSGLCQSGPGPGSWVVLLGFVALMRRRRRA